MRTRQPTVGNNSSFRTRASSKGVRENRHSSLHHARRTSNMAITLVAKETGKHYVLIVNNTRRAKPIQYAIEIYEH